MKRFIPGSVLLFWLFGFLFLGPTASADVAICDQIQTLSSYNFNLFKLKLERTDRWGDWYRYLLNNSERFNAERDERLAAALVLLEDSKAVILYEEIKGIQIAPSYETRFETKWTATQKKIVVEGVGVGTPVLCDGHPSVSFEFHQNLGAYEILGRKIILSYGWSNLDPLKTNPR